jgi:serine/threonine protein kinase/WD40 repeat protein
MHNVVPGHPSTEQLVAYSLGKLDDREAAGISAHLAECPACCTLLDHLTLRDELVSRLREVAALSEAGLEDPIQRRRAVRDFCTGQGDQETWPRAAGPSGKENSPGDPSACTTLPPISFPRQVGEYDILAEVGRGGMGVVYKARHRGLQRLVALKMVLAGEFASPAQERRFRLEAELAARVQHPNIVHVYEIGTHQGVPFLAQEWVEGGSLAQRLDGNPWSAAEAARLIETLARAIHAAHSQGVIHRDLKPANILLSGEWRVASGEGRTEEASSLATRHSPLATFVPRITDFGLAKSLDAPGGPTTAGDILGTPNYMAPEQALGDTRNVGPGADIYALGAILYELLTGRAPFQAGSVLATLEQVRTQDPMPPRLLRPRTSRDLETICLRCLRKQPGQRYPTAAALADDLQRFLEGKPIAARPVGPVELVWRWARRNPGVAMLLACVVVLLVGGSVLSTWFGLVARQQARAARYQEGQANLASDKAHAAETQALAAKRTADLRAAELAFQLGLHQAEAGAIDRGLFLMLRAWRQAPVDAVAFRTVIRANLAGWSRQLPRLRQAVHVEKSPVGWRFIGSGDAEGRTFLTWFNGGVVRAFDSATGQPVALAPFLEEKRRLHSVSPDGRWLGVDYRPGYTVFDRHTGKEAPGIAALLNRINAPYVADMSEVVLTAQHGAESVYHFWDLRAGKELAARVRLTREDDLCLTRTVEGRPVALVFRGFRAPGPAGAVRSEAIDLDTGKVLDPPLSLTGNPDPAFSYDGRERVAESNGSWRWMDVDTGRSREGVWRSRRRAVHQGLSRDGLEVLSGEIDHSLRIYDLATGLQRGGGLLREPQTGAWGSGGSIWQDYHTGMLSFGGVNSGPDGRLLFTLTRFGIARVWDTSLCRLQPTPATMPRRRQNPLLPQEFEQNQCSWSADGRRVVLTRRGQNHGLLLDARSGDLLGPPLRQPLIELAVFSPDGRYLATAPSQGTNGQFLGSDFRSLVVLRNGHTGQPIGRPWVSPKLIHALAFSPDGKLLAVGGVAGTVILDVPGNTLRHVLPETTCIRALKWSADSRRLLVMARGGWAGVGAGLRVWDAHTGQPLGPFRSAGRGYLGPEATWLADAAQAGAEEELVSCESEESGLVRLSSDGKGVRGKEATGPVRLVHLSADGSRMAASTSCNNVRQWDTRTGQLVGPALPHPEVTQLIRYSPDGKLLAVACLDDSIRLWDADTGWPLGPPLLHTATPIGLAFSDQNRTLLSITEAGIVRAWPVPHPIQDDPDRFETWLTARGGVRLEGEEPVQVSVEEWQTACRTLEQHWPQADPALAEVSNDLAPWHRQRALDAEAVGNDRGTLYHLSRLAALCPREPALHARMARVHARVAARLPVGPVRDREWRLASEAVERQRDWPQADHWARLGALEAGARQADDEVSWYLDRLAARGGDWLVFADRADLHGRRGHQALREADLKRALSLGGDKQRDFALKVADEWARQDRWADVARLLGTAHQAEPADGLLLHRLALAQLKAGDRAAHAELCKAALRDLSPQADTWRSVAIFRICSLAPAAVDNWQNPLERMERIIRRLETAESQASSEEEKKMLQGLRRELLATLAALLHRAGRSADAIQQLTRAMKLPPGGEGGPEEWVWLALAHAATEKAPGREARRCLDRARAGLPKREGEGLWQAVLLEVLVAEAAKALGGATDF